jgi:hypothetical protein
MAWPARESQRLRAPLPANTLSGSFLEHASSSQEGGGDVSHAGKFFTSIAVQLANNAPPLQRYICEAIRERSDITSKSLRDQWRQLVLGPLSKFSDDSRPSSYVLIVDALAGLPHFEVGNNSGNGKGKGEGPSLSNLPCDPLMVYQPKRKAAHTVLRFVAFLDSYSPFEL